MEIQTYNDGVLQVYCVDNISEPGCLPVEGLKLIGKLFFEERTVGVTRFYTAKQAKVTVDRVVRCQKVNMVNPYDIVKIDNEQYSVVQIQYPKDVMPLSMDLSLERLVEADEY